MPEGARKDGGPLRPRRQEALLILGLTVAIFMAMILMSYTPSDPSFNNTFEDADIENLGGTVGAHLSDLLLNGLGMSAFLVIPMILLGCSLAYRESGAGEKMTVAEHVTQASGFLLFLLSSAALETMRLYSHDFVLPGMPGGVVGYGIGKMFMETVGFQGGTLFLVATWAIGLCLFSGISILNLTRWIGAAVTRQLAAWARILSEIAGNARSAAAEAEPAPAPKSKPRAAAKKEMQEPVINFPRTQAAEAPRPAEPAASPTQEATAPKITTAAKPEPAKKSRLAANKSYSLARTELLAPPPDQSDKVPDEEELSEKSALIESKLRDFGVEVKVREASSGPVVTRYEIEPDIGVKGSQIMNLSKDLARSLSVLSIRVLETIEGKSTMGLEIPNTERQTVYLAEIINSKAFANNSSPLAIALGRDISGYPFVADLRSTPHLLVAGTTGSGKSVSLNAMILSLLFKSGPAEVKMIMIDPKMLELSVYEGIPHLLAPVVTDMEHSRAALEWCIGEMEQRYKLMAAVGVRNIEGFNEALAKHRAAGKAPDNPMGEGELEHLPYIAVIVDELADLMMVAGKKIEGLIARLSQKARAAGIHLILATQRPSVDVITGLIKANVPSRIAFQVSSRVDSRTILDQMGAESLLGKGDMLYIPISAPVPHRIHGAFVSDEEVLRIVNHLKEHYPDSEEKLDFSKVSAADPGAAAAGGGEADGEKDPLYDQAAENVIRSQRASISSVQRQLRIGYNRAARIVESMEASGLVSAPDQAGNRKVLVDAPAPD